MCCFMLAARRAAQYYRSRRACWVRVPHAACPPKVAGFDLVDDKLQAGAAHLVPLKS